MPSGKTHDRITLWCLPWVTVVAMGITHHWGYTGLVVLGFVFAGFMFGPDLDVRSVQSRRWGWLAWIWRPYRHSLRHRSLWSHGFLAGTVVRCLYLALWIFLGILVVLEFSNTSGRTSVTWGDLGHSTATIARQHWRIWLALAIGIEVGAMSHSLSDWTVSAWKRERRNAATKGRSRRKKSR